MHKELSDTTETQLARAVVQALERGECPGCLGRHLIRLGCVTYAEGGDLPHNIAGLLGDFITAGIETVIEGFVEDNVRH